MNRVPQLHFLRHLILQSTRVDSLTPNLYFLELTARGVP